MSSRSSEVNKNQNSQIGQILIFFKRRQIIPQNKALELISTGGWLEGPTRGCVKAPTLRVFTVSLFTGIGC